MNHIDRITVLAQAVALTEMIDESGDASFQEFMSTRAGEMDQDDPPTLTYLFVQYLEWANGPDGVPPHRPEIEGDYWPDPRGPEIVKAFKSLGHLNDVLDKGTDIG